MERDYVDRINRALDYILEDPARPLNLETIARVACFSPYHFHRIFRAATGETLHQFIKRIRLERALYLMAHGSPGSLTELALRCGFASSSDFSRSFRQRYGVPPSAFDLDAFRRERRREMQELLTPDADQRHLLRELPPGENPDGFNVTVRELPARVVAYIRVHRPYEGNGVVGAAARLVEWAEERDLADGQWLGYQWDDPTIVALDRCRYDVGLEVADRSAEGVENVVMEGEVGRLELPPMHVAEIEVRGAIDLEQRAIDYLFGTWLPKSIWEPAPYPAFEAWIGRPFAHGHEHFELWVQLPVIKAGRRT
ncbi:MAG: AraC family transcriptional regulator [Myxococcota bacterium]